MHSSIVFIFSLCFLFFGCSKKSKISEAPFLENFNCSTGSMEAAWYPSGIDEPIPAIKNLNNDFIIFVDTNSKSVNFISLEEEFLRGQVSNPDTTFLKFLRQINGENSGTKNSKMVEDPKILYRQQADFEHKKNNNGKSQIWLINNSSDIATVQMQDGSYICILQGLTRRGQWFPIQYWRFSKCGNSYYDKQFPPKIANSFITIIPRNGDYETKLRFKLLGSDKFYYSNEFVGKINYCDFLDASTNYMDGTRSYQSHYRLDTLIYLSM